MDHAGQLCGGAVGPGASNTVVLNLSRQSCAGDVLRALWTRLCPVSDTTNGSNVTGTGAGAAALHPVQQLGWRLTWGGRFLAEVRSSCGRHG